MAPGRRANGFTLLEVLVTMVLSLLVIIVAINSLYVFDNTTRRVAVHNSALVIAEARLEEVRATEYNPPNTPFTSASGYTTNAITIALDEKGSNYLVKGSVITYFQPVAAGHLVTANVHFTNQGRPLSVGLQTLVNKFSGGQP
jgi:prepilin-type N-terminal cleavage/methylation domain-containing protein